MRVFQACLVFAASALIVDVLHKGSIASTQLMSLVVWVLIMGTLLHFYVPIRWMTRTYMFSLESIFVLMLWVTQGTAFALIGVGMALLLYHVSPVYPGRSEFKIDNITVTFIQYAAPLDFLGKVFDFGRLTPLETLWALFVTMALAEFVLIILAMGDDMVVLGAGLNEVLERWLLSWDVVFYHLSVITLIPSLVFVSIELLRGGYAWATFFLLPPFVGLRTSMMSFQKMDQEFSATIESFKSALDAKDPYSEKHCERVARYSRIIAGSFGYKEQELERIEKEAMLHDIGKIFVRDDVLKKPDKLTNEEYEHIKQHTHLDEPILDKIPKSYPVAQWLEMGRLHHERYDGKGYPKGLKGESIPLDARIIAVADAWDAMRSSRVYRTVPLTDEKAMQIFRENAGQQWDAKIIDAFLKAYAAGAIQEVDKQLPKAPLSDSTSG